MKIEAAQIFLFRASATATLYALLPHRTCVEATSSPDRLNALLVFAISAFSGYPSVGGLLEFVKMTIFIIKLQALSSPLSISNTEY